MVATPDKWIKFKIGVSADWYVLWQPLTTKTYDYTSSRSLKLDIKWKVHKRTQQGVSA